MSVQVVGSLVATPKYCNTIPAVFIGSLMYLGVLA